MGSSTRFYGLPQGSPGASSSIRVEVEMDTPGMDRYHQPMPHEEDASSAQSSRSEPDESSPSLDAEPEDALILWMLSLTPTQRLEVAQGFVDSVQALRDGARS